MYACMYICMYDVGVCVICCLQGFAVNILLTYYCYIGETFSKRLHSIVVI